MLRALGASDRTLRSIVHCQVMVTIGIGVVVGVPVGVAAGRGLWRSFAAQLGVVPDAVVPLRQLAVAIAASQVLAAVVAWLPAKAAAGTRLAAVLRQG